MSMIWTGWFVSPEPSSLGPFESVGVPAYTTFRTRAMDLKNLGLS